LFCRLPNKVGLSEELSILIPIGGEGPYFPHLSVARGRRERLSRALRDFKSAGTARVKEKRVTILFLARKEPRAYSHREGKRKDSGSSIFLIGDPEKKDGEQALILGNAARLSEKRGVKKG